MKHTPGPWEHNDYQIIAGETVIANCTYGARNSNNANDARLIASAPDLLEALKAIIGDNPEDKYGYRAARNAMDDDKRQAARAAIAKATGENQ